MHSLQLISDAELDSFLDQIPVDLEQEFFSLKDADISTEAFSFYTSVASVFSSKIEGEEIELDSYIKHKRFGIEFSPDYTRKITNAHKGGTPAVVIHCAMHTYRTLAVDDWREFLGVTSRHHDHQARYPVTPTAAAKNHPAMRGFPDQWITPMDELYIIEKTWPKTTALATSVSEKDGKTYPAIWTNDYYGTRVFGTTYGHGNATWHDPVFLTLIARGVRWAAGRDN